MMGERQLSLGKKKCLIHGGLNFFSWTWLKSISWGLDGSSQLAMSIGLAGEERGRWWRRESARSPLPLSPT